VQNEIIIILVSR